MLTNAARGGFHPRAPRSHSRGSRARIGTSSRAFLRAVGAIVVLASCGADQPTAPTSETYVAELNGANERPPRATSGTGTATFRVDGALARYEVAVSGLSGAAAVAHVVIGNEQTVVGQIVLALAVRAPTGTIASGTIDLSRPITFNNTTISGDSLRSLFDRGSAYVNVYSTVYPGGEVRGQIIRR